MTKTPPAQRAAVAAHEAALKAKGVLRVSVRLGERHRALLDALAKRKGSKQAALEAALEREADALGVVL